MQSNSKEELKALFEKQVVLFDGAMGSSLQALEGREPLNYGGDQYRGCIEALNLYSPKAIQTVHESFIRAGARIIEINTFGANRIVLAEYGLQDQAGEINRSAVRIASLAAQGSGQKIWLAGSMGPSTKMPSLGHVDFDAMAQAYAPQIRCLIQDGVDILTIETCQDMLQAKILLILIGDILKEFGIPAVERPFIMVSLTLETTGAMLTGSDLETAIATLSPFRPDILGLNCATGPKRMEPYLSTLREKFPGYISLIPNAGMPLIQNGKTVYPETPGEFSETLAGFAERYGIDAVGGCCGTTPEHIRELAQRLGPVRKKTRPAPPPMVSSLYSAVALRQTPPPLIIGERANATGSKKFREMLLSNRFDEMIGLAQDQEKEGAHVADISLSYTGRDEAADTARFYDMARTQVRMPLMIDSTNPDAIEKALKLTAGRCLINSINLEDGGEKLDRICGLAGRFRAPVVALTIDERGMAVELEHKLEIVARIRTLCADKFGLLDGDVIYDALTFTVGSGEAKYRNAARNTLEAVRRIKQQYPGALTSLGVSNVSYGLAPESRFYLNTVFLNLAVERGLDMAIVHSGKIIPYHAIPAGIKDLCLRLLMNEGEQPLADFMNYFNKNKESGPGTAALKQRVLPPEKAIQQKIINGDKREIEALLERLLSKHRPEEIINRYLIPAMKKVGTLFNSGDMQLPFVLQAAEVMKACMQVLEPRLERKTKPSAGKLIIGTVEGDVHDIGKNLVQIILSNNGYQVVDLGTKAPVSKFIDAIEKHRPDAMGMSGLLVQSANRMLENLKFLSSRGVRLPVLLGGAALTPGFVKKECQTVYDGPVIYCRDVFAGYNAMANLKHLKPGKSGTHKPRKTPARKPRPAEPKAPGLKQDAGTIPVPPFFGVRRLKALSFAEVEPFINKKALVRGRWAVRRGGMEPAFRRIFREFAEKAWFKPKVSYGYFRCYSDRETLAAVDKSGKIIQRFVFPRQRRSPNRCLADLFRNKETAKSRGWDIMGVLAVTLGRDIIKRLKAMYSKDKYSDYFLIHGMAAEVTDALAEAVHRRMREEAGMGGLRFSFGYPSCPDLKQNKGLLRLLKAGSMGVALTSGFEMEPEFTTAAIVARHPRARYFTV